MSLKKTDPRERRKRRVRAKVSGTAERPRVSVFKSNRSIYVQLIDDEAGRTLVGLDLRHSINKPLTVVAANELGQELAKKALESNIKKVVFDRGRNIYHGRVKALADGARQNGLEF